MGVRRCLLRITTLAEPLWSKASTAPPRSTGCQFSQSVLHLEPSGQRTARSSVFRLALIPPRMKSCRALMPLGPLGRVSVALSVRGQPAIGETARLRRSSGVNGCWLFPAVAARLPPASIGPRLAADSSTSTPRLTRRIPNDPFTRLRLTRATSGGPPGTVSRSLHVL